MSAKNKAIGLILLIFTLSSLSPVFPKAFQVGEELHYRIKWGLLTVGYASMTVPRKTFFLGTECLVFQSHAQSTGVIGVLFPVRDRITSCWDPVKRRTLFSEKDLHEGNYHRNARVLFNHARRSARWQEREFSGNTDELGKKRKGAKWKRRQGTARNLPEVVQDMLSAVYYNRSHPARGGPGVSFHLDVFDDSRLTRLKMSLLRREHIKLEVNGETLRFPALVVRPYIKSAGIFKSRGKILLWISDDEYRRPLKVTAKVAPVGNITVKLYRMRGVRE